MPTTAHCRVSVVIPALNEEGNIGALLDSLATQSIPPDEVIVADAGSEDATREEARARAARFSRFQVVELSKAYPGRARNEGAAVASGEWILFIDCGMRIGPDCVAALTRQAKESGAVAVFGRVVPETPNLFTECAAVAYLPPLFRGEEPVLRPTVPMLFIRRETFAGMRGFPENLRSGEDLIFLQELHAQHASTSFAPTAIAHWQLAPNIGATFRRFRVYSLSNIRAGLARQWHFRVWLYYGLLLSISILAMLYTRNLWVPALATAAFFSVRSMKSLWRHRDDLRDGIKRYVLRFVGVAAIFALLDFATLAGTYDFLRGKRGASS